MIPQEAPRGTNRAAARCRLLIFTPESRFESLERMMLPASASLCFPPALNRACGCDWVGSPFWHLNFLSSYPFRFRSFGARTYPAAEIIRAKVSSVNAPNARADPNRLAFSRAGTCLDVGRAMAGTDSCAAGCTCLLAQVSAGAAPGIIRARVHTICVSLLAQGFLLPQGRHFRGVPHDCSAGLALGAAALREARAGPNAPVACPPLPLPPLTPTSGPHPSQPC